MDEQVFVGMDLHKRGAVLAVLRSAQNASNLFPQSTEVIRVGNRRNEFVDLASRIQRICVSRERVSILFEGWSLGMPAPIVYFLHQQGYPLFQIPAAAASEARRRLLGRETKTDELDASALAYLLYLHKVLGLPIPIVRVTSTIRGRTALIRQLVSQRWQLTKMQTQVTNRLKALVAAVFPEGEEEFFGSLLPVLPEVPTPEDLVAAARSGNLKMPWTSQSRREKLLSLAADTVGLPGHQLRDIIRTFAALRRGIEEHRKRIDRHLADELQDDQVYRLLMSFPGMGIVTAATLTGVIGDIGRWKNLAAFRKAMGVYGALRQSGSGPPVTVRGKGGNRAAKRTLYLLGMLSLSPRVPDNDFRDYYRRQVARGKPHRKAMYATMAKIAKIIFVCLRRGVPYQYQGRSREPDQGARQQSSS